MRNVILCEDIRDEMGNKKSLMGVLAGDIVVGELPATLSVAIYFEYVPDAADGSEFSATFRLLIDDGEIAQGAIEAPIEKGSVVTLILPKALVGFQKPSIFRMMLTVRGGPEFEVLEKKVMLPASSNASPQPS
jgi:hypothetical protein